MSDTTKEASFQCWAIVELMGHQKTAGLVSEQNIAGHGMIRVDVPNSKGETICTRFYSPSALYCLTPVDKQIAIGYAAHYVERPVTIYDLRKLVADKKVGEGEHDSAPDTDPRDYE
jgi:hypothetical protein